MFVGRGTQIIRDMRFLGKGNTFHFGYVFPVFSCRGTDITRDICFLCRRTHITRDKYSLPMKHISLGIIMCPR